LRGNARELALFDKAADDRLLESDLVGVFMTAGQANDYTGAAALLGSLT
jgi:hypothetical protein